jgi:tetratricopeptide (TPR) repeat protein
MAALGESAAGRIRSAIQLPTVDLSVFMVFMTGDTVGSDADPVDPEASIVELRGRLQGRPSDAATLVSIAERTRSTRDADRAKEAVRVAVDAARGWREGEPGNPAAIVAWSRALRLEGREKEAEELLRRAGSPPDSALVSAEMGNLLLARAMQQAGTSGVVGLMEGRVLEPGLRKTFDECVVTMGRAIESFSEAIRLEPKEASHRLGRARAEGWRSYLSAGLERQGDDGRSPVPPVVRMFTEKSFADLEAALRLSPEDPEVLATVAGARAIRWVERALRDSRKWEDVMGGGIMGMMRMMSDEDRREVMDLMRRLERVAEGVPAGKKARAWEALAKLQLAVAGEVTTARDLAMRVLRIDARHLEAFNLVMAATVGGEDGARDWGIAEEAVRLRMRVLPDARTRLILIKVLDMRGKRDEAVQVAVEAEKAHPENGEFTEAALAVRLRRGDRLDSEGDAAWLAKFRGRMVEAWKQGPSSPAVLHEMVTFSLGTALLGDLNEARSRVRRLMGVAPDDRYVREADAVLREVSRE